MRSSLTIKEFCEAHGISRTTFHEMRKDDTAPALMRVGKRLHISAQAHEAWLRRMEEAVTQPKNSER